jgi:hypothetical protein
VTTDLGSLLNLQLGLNPWLVVLLSSIAGLLAFAVSNALYVVHLRHRRVATRGEQPRSTRARRALIASAGAFGVLALALAIPGPKLVDGMGWLTGHDLFAVSSRAGFAASYPSADRDVRAGDVILQLMRDAGPDEMAAAASQRALLAQDLEFTKLETLRVDPLLLAAHSTEKDQLDDLTERRRGLVEMQESLVRGQLRQELSDQGRVGDVEQELTGARFELEQTESSLTAAETSFAIATKSDVPGVFPRDEINRREERVSLLRSRREELREQIELLLREQTNLTALTAASQTTDSEQITLRSTELETIDAEIAASRDRLQAAWNAVEIDKVRAERQREHRIRQIELQMAEFDQLLDARAGTLDVRAPWDGRVGFREPSPASARLSNRPLLVLYKPGSIAVRMPVTADRARLSGDSDVGIAMTALIPEASSSTFSGRVVQGTQLPDGSAELQITADPPAAAVRELASGTSVPVHVVVRRLNPLAAADIGWGWWLLIAAVLGTSCSEARLWWLRRQARAAAAAGVEAPKAGFHIDWGGNPDEFLEYVVGVGIVPRKLRRAVSSIDVPNERRRPVAAPARAKPQASAAGQR